MTHERLPSDAVRTNRAFLEAATAIQQVGPIHVHDREHAELLESVRDAIEEHLGPHARRREVELALADYIGRGVNHYRTGARPTRQTADLVEKMRHCRQVGKFGVVDGKPIIAWESKCSCSKLCPDESRLETMRVLDRYAPHVLDYMKSGLHVHFGVLTLKNYPRGELAAGQLEIFDRLKRVIARPEVGKITGALAVLEAPLSEHGDWNVHVNVFLVVDGWLDYRALQSAWGAGMRIRRLKGGAGEVADAFKELIKYSARAVAEKSDDKARAHKTDAPPMVEWPIDAWLEWWDANNRFRRTRSYGKCDRVPLEDDPTKTRLVPRRGSLYGIAKPEPKLVELARAKWLFDVFYDDGRYLAEIRERVGDPLFLIRAEGSQGDNSTVQVDEIAQGVLEFSTGPPGHDRGG